MATSKKQNPKKRGRKPKRLADKFVAIGITLRPDVAKRITAGAKSAGVTRSQYVCSILAASVAAEA